MNDTVLFLSNVYELLISYCVFQKISIPRPLVASLPQEARESLWREKLQKRK